MTIASLPTYDLYIGFYQFAGSSTTPLIDYPSTFALPASGASNTQWTNASAYLLTHSLAFGKQHYTDRAQPATANMTLNARDGFFFNGSVNGQGVTLRRNMPIAITETISGTQTAVYMGFVQQVHEQPIDQVNDVITVDCVDFSGLLSTTSATNPHLYGQYANSGHAQHWYRLGVPQMVNIVAAFNYVPAWITGVTVSTSQVLYVVAGSNSLTVGETVTSSGLTGTGTNTNTLCYSQMTVAQVVGQYVVANLAIGTTPAGSLSSQGNGTIYNVTIYDQIGSTNGIYAGIVSWPNQGALVYDTDSCVDLGAGGYGTSSGYLLWPISTTSGVEGWVLGLNIANQTIISMTNGSANIKLRIGLDGTLVLVADSGSPVSYYGSNIPITDGYWHHVGLFCISGTLYIYCDGNFTSTAYSMSGTTFTPDTFFGDFVVGYGIGGGNMLGAYVDEVIFSSYGVTQGEVQYRYVAGHLCQSVKYSGDRIAELLFIAGFGSISISPLGITTPTNFFTIGQSYGSTSDYNSVAGTAGAAQVEPYYWDSPITGSMILDLINQVTSTDYGVFIQLQNGTFSFYTQGWFGNWVYTENPATQTPSAYSWTPYSSSWASAPTLSDDGTGIAYVTSAIDIISDGSDQYTIVDVDPQAGQRQVIELSSANTALYGSTTLQVSSNLPTSLSQARSLGWYLGYIFRPSLLRRVDSVTTGTEQNNGGNNATLASLFIWSVVFFKRTPPNASTSGTDKGQINYAMAVESLKIDFNSAEGYVHWTFGLSPYEVGT